MKILPTNDLLFKKVFSSHGNEDVLLGFINDILGMSFKSVQARETYDIKKIRTNKLDYTEVDVRAQTESGEYVTIEMQILNHTLFLSRSAYYASQTYNNQYKKENKSNPYADLKQIYSINIVDFDPFDDKNVPLQRFSMMNMKNNKLFTDFGAKFIDLTYFILPNALLTDDSRLKYWEEYFRGRSLSKDAPEYIQKAYQLASFNNLTKEEQDMAETISKQQAIRNAEKEYARREGLAEGLVEGLAKGKAEAVQDVALNLLNSNVDLSIIIQSTGLSKDDIEALKNEQKHSEGNGHG